MLPIQILQIIISRAYYFSQSSIWSSTVELLLPKVRFRNMKKKKIFFWWPQLSGASQQEKYLWHPTMIPKVEILGTIFNSNSIQPVGSPYGTLYYRWLKLFLPSKWPQMYNTLKYLVQGTDITEVHLCFSTKHSHKKYCYYKSSKIILYW